MMVRDKKIDIAKAIGIILVVLGHAGIPHSTLIFRFHMALFFALSGWCFNDKNIESFNALIMYIKRKIFGLYIPFLLFNGITLLARNLLIKINIYTDNPAFLEGTLGGNVYGITCYLSLSEMKPWIINVLKFSGESQLGGATWFLRVLFGITILYAIINYILKTIAKFNEEQVGILNIIISVMTIWVAYNWMKDDVHLFLQFETVVSVYSVYCIGYYLRILSERHTQKSIIQNLILALLMFIILYYCDNRCKFNGWNSNVNIFSNPFMYLTSSAAGILCVLSASSIISKLKHTSLLTYIGRHTMSVIFWHFLSFKAVTLIECLLLKQPMYRIASFPVMVSENGWWILYTLVGVMLPMVISYIYESLKHIAVRLKEKIKERNYG